MPQRDYRVRASYCDHRATEDEIFDVLRRTTDPLTRSWERLEKARRIVLKFNMTKPAQRVAYFEGRRRELVDDAREDLRLEEFRPRVLTSFVRNKLLGELLLLADHAEPEDHQHAGRKEHGDQEQEDLPPVWERSHD